MMPLAPLAVAQAPPCPAADANVTTQHNDTCRTGWQRYEYTLSPSTVSHSTFGLLWQYPVEGAVFAQPLAYHAGSGTTIGSGTASCSNCDVVFIADEMDYVYAFEAESPASSVTPLWSVDVAGTNGEWPCLTIVLPCNMGVVGPYMGITGTPVIDEVNKIIYVVALEDVSGAPEYFLAAINLLNGVVLANLQIEPTFPGVSQDNPCATAVGSGTVSFAPADSIQRPGLLLLGNSIAGVYGTVYIGFAPAERTEWTNGWLLGYQYASSGGAGSLAQAFVLNTTPYGTGGGVWMGGSGLVAADATVGGTNGPYIFASTGNGTFDFDSPKNNFADSLLRLNPAGLAISDYFTPADEFTYSGPYGTGRCPNDIDLNSYGLIALPDEAQPLMSAHPRLIVAADKEAKLYVVDRDSLTEYSRPTDRIVQEIQTPPIAIYTKVRGYWGYPAYYEWTAGVATYRALYYSVRGVTDQNTNIGTPFPIDQYTLTPTGPIPTWSTSILSTPDVYCPSGPAPSASSDGSADGVLWAIEATNSGNPQGSLNPTCPSGTNEPGTYYLYLALHAYDATNISSELYNGRMYNSGPPTGYPVTFGTPTVFDGKVFVGARDATNTSGIVDVWGLCSESPSGCLE